MDNLDAPHAAAQADAVATLRHVAGALEALPPIAPCEALVCLVDVVEELRQRAGLVLPG